MKRILLSAILASASFSAAQAQDSADSPTPLVFDVRPSRFEESADERQERLLRRSRDLDFAFRSICKGCGAAYAPQAGTAFSPLNALAARPNRQNRPEPERSDGAR